MEYNRLIDRKAETDRITEALKRENTQFIVIYGLRCGSPWIAHQAC